VSTTLELSKDTKEKLAALRTLSEKAEGGDKKARKELRKAVRESAPEVTSRASDVGRRGQWALIKPAGGPLDGEDMFIVALDRSPGDTRECATVG
jgi:hypothetical protein